VTGQYLYHQSPQQVPDRAHSTDEQDALFDYCTELTGQALD
jgi:hypothetical protein